MESLNNMALKKQELAESRLAKRIDENNLNLFKLEKKLNGGKAELTQYIDKNKIEISQALNDLENKFNDNRDKLIQGIDNNKVELSQNINDLKNEFNHELLETVRTVFERLDGFNNVNNELVDCVRKDFKHNIEILKQENLTLIQNMQHQLNLVTAEKNSLVTIALDLVKEKESNSFLKRHFRLFRKNQDLYKDICNHRRYMDGLIFLNNYFKKDSIINISNTMPYNTYIEYKVNGYGNKINFFLFSNIGAKLFLEVVLHGKIVKQESFIVNYEGMYTCLLPENIRGEAFIRFKTLDNCSIVRVLEILNRKLMFFSKKSLAAYVE